MAKSLASSWRPLLHEAPCCKSSVIRKLEPWLWGCDTWALFCSECSLLWQAAPESTSITLFACPIISSLLKLHPLTDAQIKPTRKKKLVAEVEWFPARSTLHSYAWGSMAVPTSISLQCINHQPWWHSAPAKHYYPGGDFTFTYWSYQCRFFWHRQASIAQLNFFNDKSKFAARCCMLVRLDLQKCTRKGLNWWLLSRSACSVFL